MMIGGIGGLLKFVLRAAKSHGSSDIAGAVILCPADALQVGRLSADFRASRDVLSHQVCSAEFVAMRAFIYLYRPSCP